MLDNNKQFETQIEQLKPRKSHWLKTCLIVVNIYDKKMMKCMFSRFEIVNSTRC